MFTPALGKLSNLTNNMFQMSWNHKLDIVGRHPEKNIKKIWWYFCVPSSPLKKSSEQTWAKEVECAKQSSSNSTRGSTWWGCCFLSLVFPYFCYKILDLQNRHRTKHHFQQLWPKPGVASKKMLHTVVWNTKKSAYVIYCLKLQLVQPFQSWLEMLCGISGHIFWDLLLPQKSCYTLTAIPWQPLENGSHAFPWSSLFFCSGKRHEFCLEGGKHPNCMMFEHI